MEGKCSGARTNCAVSALVLGSPTPPASIAGAQHLWTSRSPTRRQRAVVGATAREAEQELADHAVGSQITVELFKKGDYVDVTGTTRGFGFQGVMKRHHMKGAARDSSTAHELHRHPGAIGQRKTPGRVFKNKRMPGHMGVDRRTVQNLPVVDVIPENNLLLVGGSIPGHRNNVVIVRPAVV